MNRYDTLDAMRGVAAFLIILRHTQAFWGGIAFANSYLAVDFFFLLSGFVVSHAYEARLMTQMSVMQFMKLRLIRLYPLYAIGFVVSAVGLLLHFYSLPYTGWKLSWVVGGAALMVPFPSHDQIFPLNGPAWSLWCELAGNLIYALVVKALTTKRLMVLVWLCGLVVVVSAFISHKGGIDGGFTLKTIPVAMARFGFSFGLGIVIGRGRAIWGERRTVNLPLSLAPLAILFGLLAFPELGRWGEGAYAAACAVVIFPVLLIFAADYEPPAWLLPTFRRLGVCSYPVYILQVPAAVLCAGLLRDAGLSPERFAPWSGLVFVGLLTFASMILVKYIEQPVRQRLRQVAQFTRTHVQRTFSRAGA